MSGHVRRPGWSGPIRVVPVGSPVIDPVATVRGSTTQAYTRERLRDAPHPIRRRDVAFSRIVLSYPDEAFFAAK